MASRFRRIRRALLPLAALLSAGAGGLLVWPQDPHLIEFDLPGRAGPPTWVAVVRYEGQLGLVTRRPLPRPAPGAATVAILNDRRRPERFRRYGWAGFEIAAGEDLITGLSNQGPAAKQYDYVHGVAVPGWFALGAATALPVAWGVRLWRGQSRRRRVARGLCIGCGYDLR